MAHIQKRNGKWQARYRAPDGHEKTHRFDRKVDAETWLDTNGADIARGVWVDPEAGKVTVRDYAEEWLAQRPKLRQTTKGKYRGLLDRHILPQLGDLTMANLLPSRVRGWNAQLQDRPATAANAYRLLGAICRTAVDDGGIGRSPCRVKGAASEQSAERPTITIPELDAAVKAAADKWRLAILLAAWCQLRRGEALGLQRKDIDELHGTITVRRAVVMDSATGAPITGKPKTEAGQRTVAIPPNVTAALTDHLERHAGSLWVFPGPEGPAHPRALSFAWTKARNAVARPDIHFHDLRHSGLTWAAATGATTAELMARAGHSSPTTALRYQHATEDRDRVLAEALGQLAQADIVSISADKRRTAAT